MVIQTTIGQVDDRLLSKRVFAEGGHRIIEYYSNGELVHRSVDVQLTGVQVQGTAKL